MIVYYRHPQMLIWVLSCLLFFSGNKDDGIATGLEYMVIFISTSRLACMVGSLLLHHHCPFVQTSGDRRVPFLDSNSSQVGADAQVQPLSACSTSICVTHIFCF
jgi:hypothetical protein